MGVLEIKWIVHVNSLFTHFTQMFFPHEELRTLYAKIAEAQNKALGVPVHLHPDL